MYGSYDWQLHVRLNNTRVDRKFAFVINKGEVPREIGQLMAKCNSAIGQDVTRDIGRVFSGGPGFVRLVLKHMPPTAH
jgi:hypothetical protein